MLLGGDLIYINTERLSNNPKNQPPWLGGIKLSRSFINSIPNEKDLDKLRKQQNYQHYQSINGLTEIMKIWGQLHTFTDLTISIFYPRSLTSKVRGLKNRNILYFQKTYPQLNINWYEDSTRNTVRCCSDGIQYVL